MESDWERTQRQKPAPGKRNLGTSLCSMCRAGSQEACGVQTTNSPLDLLVRRLLVTF
jgi:hypothetical protein